MTRFLGAIWVFPGQPIAYWIVFTGRGCVKMSAHIWPHARFAWPGSLLAHGGLSWDMSRWATNGIGWPWICWTCQLRPQRATGTSWWTVSLDGPRLARCLIKRLWLLLMHFFSTLFAGSECRLSYIRIMAGRII